MPDELSTYPILTPSYQVHFSTSVLLSQAHSGLLHTTLIIPSPFPFDTRKMRFLASTTVTLAILFSMYIEAAPTAEIVHIQGSTVNPQTRRIVSLAIDCASYGEFEPFTGSCETTSKLISPSHSGAQRLIKEQTAVHGEGIVRLRASQVVLVSQVSIFPQWSLFRYKVDKVCRCAMSSKGVLLH
jgi:hypothetical protein